MPGSSASAGSSPASGGWPATTTTAGGRSSRSACATPALAALTIATASNRWFAICFVLGALASFALLSGAARGVKALARKLHGAGGVTLRLALANLHRPGATTTGVVLSLGLGLSGFGVLCEKLFGHE